MAAEISAAAPSLGGLLALQEMDAPTERDRRAHRHAQEMLDELQGLQVEMLGATPDPGRLERLAAMVGAIPLASHRGLRDAVASVATRVEVEMARQFLRARAISILRRE
jgi:hypothetical protein